MRVETSVDLAGIAKALVPEDVWAELQKPGGQFSRELIAKYARTDEIPATVNKIRSTD